LELFNSFQKERKKEEFTLFAVKQLNYYPESFLLTPHHLLTEISI
jgi:hypothetical protein